MYFIAEAQFNGKERIIEVKHKITEDEYKRIMSCFSFAGKISSVKTAHEIAVRNGREFLSFMKPENLSKLHFQEQREPVFIGTEANRLISNFCASVQTFIDYATKAVSYQGKEKEGEFNKFKSSLFDKELAYRFFYKLRNFCVHYSYPFSSITISEPQNVTVQCHKESLLQYDGWGAIVGKDLKMMPDVIDICQFINPLLVVITSLELMTYFYYAEDIFEANKAVATLQKKYQVNVPIMLSEDDQGNRALHPIPITQVMESMKMLEHNPYVKINYVDEGDKMELTKTLNEQE